MALITKLRRVFLQGLMKNTTSSNFLKLPFSFLDSLTDEIKILLSKETEIMSKDTREESIHHCFSEIITLLLHKN